MDKRKTRKGKTPLTVVAVFSLCAVLPAAMTAAGVEGERGKVQLWENGPYWAETNVGAEKPWEYGYYFWWGDTVGYRYGTDGWTASDGSVKGFSFEPRNVTTFGMSPSALKNDGWITADNVLSPEKDAARVQWGGAWRMPTCREMLDLYERCDWIWTVTNGVRGYVVRGRGDYASASVFLPAAGYAHDRFLYFPGGYGCYDWSSLPVLKIGYYAWCLFFNESIRTTSSDFRECGQSIRPVQGFPGRGRK